MADAIDDLPPLEDLSVGVKPPAVPATAASSGVSETAEAKKETSAPKPSDKLKASQAAFKKSLENTEFKTMKQILDEEKKKVKSGAAAVKEEVEEEELGEGEDNLQDALMAAAMGKTKKTVEEKKVEEAKAAAITKDFGKGGGMKKGFLLGGGGGGGAKKTATSSSSSGSSSTAASSIPLIKRDPTKDLEGMVLPEVQEAMKARLPHGLQDTNAWLTKDLMQKMMSDPKLMEGMANPKYMQALREMQEDAAKGFEKYKDDKGFQAFFRSYTAVMADHFTKLGEKKEQENKLNPGSSDARKVKEEEEKKKKEKEKAGPKVLITELAEDDEEAAKAKAKASALVVSSSSAGAGAPSVSSSSGPSSKPSKAFISSSSASDIGLSEASSVKKSSPQGPLPPPHVDDIVDMAKKGEIKADEDVKAVLSNKELMQVLADPETQKMMTECAKDGSKLRFYLGIPEMRKRLQMLEKHGLVKLM